MNWDAIGAVGEILGAIAVVVTLVYLARQLRENTASNRVTSSWAMTASFNSMHEMVASNPQFAEAVRKALANEDLEPTEIFQLNSIILHYINTLIAADDARISGHMSDEHWQRAQRDLAWTLTPKLRPLVINQLSVFPDDVVERIYGTIGPWRSEESGTTDV